MKFSSQLQLLFLCIGFVFHGKAQNAFYDSKRIVDCIKKDEAKSVIPILLTYAKNPEDFPWEKMSKKYPDHVKLLKQRSEALNMKNFEALLNDQEGLTNKLKLLPTNNASFTDFKKVVQDYYQVKRVYEEDKKQQQGLENEIRQSKGQSALDSMLEHAERLTTLDSNTTQDDSTHIDRNVKNLMSVFVKRNETLQSLEELHAEVIQELQTKVVYTKFFPETSYNTDIASSKEFNSNDFKLQVKEERDIRDKEFSEASNSSAVNYSVPSQAQMIDALSIYLAKRVKQEVSINFIEKLSGYIRDQALLSNLFPSTLKLLNNRDAYMRPKFGTSWQIALSEDFVKIPEHLTLCLPARYSKLIPYIDDGVRIGNLVQEHYSFLEAVNVLYEEPLKVKAFKNSNSILYIINHEFYNTTTKNNYWVNAEQLQQMDKEQLEWLYILLDIKYGDSINAVMNPTWLGKTVWREAYFEKKIVPFKNWISRILVQLNHFEQGAKQGSNEKETVSAGQVLAGYWKFQNDLMDVVIDTNFIHVPTKAYNYINFTRGLFSIYSGLESKNYPLVVDQVLKLFTMLEIDKQVNLQDVFYTKNFTNLLKKKDDETKADIVNLIMSLNTTYDRMVTSTSMSEMLDEYSLLCKKLKQKGRLNALNLNSNSEEFKQHLVQRINSRNEFVLDSFLFRSDFIAELENDASRQQDILPLLKQMRGNYWELQGLKHVGDNGLKTFDTLRAMIKVNQLDRKNNFKIQKNQLNSFVTEKLFSLEAPTYHAYLHRIESRSQYKKVMTTLSFLSDVMQSENSQNLSKVIEAYSLPASSYKIKRHSRRSINIDALVGAYAGVEYIKDSFGNSVFTPVSGLSAPIGISMSWGKRGKLSMKENNQLAEYEFGFVNRKGAFRKLKGYNLTLMLSLIDIGAVVSYRITGKKEGGLPADAKWSQVVSPGLTALVGIKGMPLCIGTGARFTPNLRTLSGGLQRNALRFDIGLYFDLPLVNVYYK